MQPTKQMITRPQPKAVAVRTTTEGFFWHWSADDRVEPASSHQDGMWGGFFYEEVECENPFMAHG